MRHLKYYLILLFFILTSVNQGNVFAETYVIGSSETNWVRYEKKSDGFAISVPYSWMEFNISNKAQIQTLSKFIAKDPNADENYKAMLEKVVNSGYIKFFAYDNNSLTSEFLTNINIIKEHLVYEISLDVYIEHSKALLKEMLSLDKPVLNRRIKTNSGEAEVLQYIITTANQVVVINQIIVVEKKEAFIVTLSTSESQAENYRLIFEKIGQSFEILQ